MEAVTDVWHTLKRMNVRTLAQQVVQLGACAVDMVQTVQISGEAVGTAPNCRFDRLQCSHDVEDAHAGHG